MDSNVNMSSANLMDYAEMENYKGKSTAEIKMEKMLAFWRWNYQVLLKPQVLIFTAIVNDLLTNVGVIDLMKQLVSLNLVNDVKALFQLSNKAFTFVEFSDSTSALKFQNLSKTINGINIAFVNPVPPVNFVNLFIEKLPVYILNEHLPKILMEWGEVINITPTYTKLMNGKDCETGSCKIKFKLKNDMSMTDIPYFIKIERLKVYVHIPQRPKICFRCLAKDHLVSNCNFRFCYKCKAYKGISHECIQSYAQRLSNSLNNWHASLLQAQEDCLVSEISSLNNSATKPPDIDLQEIVNSTTECKVNKDFSGTPHSEETNKKNDSSIISPVKEIMVDGIINKRSNTTNQVECTLANEVVEVASNPNGEKIKALLNQSQSKKRLAVETLSSKTKKKLPIEITKTYSLRNKTEIQYPNNSSDDDAIPMELTNDSKIENNDSDDNFR